MTKKSQKVRECSCVIEQTWGDGSKSTIDIERVPGADFLTITENRETVHMLLEAWPLVRARIDQYFGFQQENRKDSETFAFSPITVETEGELYSPQFMKAWLKSVEGIDPFDWERRNLSARGGFTKKTLESIGLPWPPKKSWLKPWKDQWRNNQPFCPAVLESSCCGAGVRVEGSREGTRYHVCESCGKPCDVVGSLTKKKIQ